MGESPAISQLRARGLTVVERPVAVLYANRRNARRHSKKQIAEIADSIKAFGWINPIVVDQEGVIISGHGRFAAAKMLGMSRVPTIMVSDLNETEKRAVLIADNAIAQKAGWDRKRLAVELGELEALLPEIKLDLSITGFDTIQLAALSAPSPRKRHSGEDRLEPLPDSAICEAGDCWALGSHRLMCGRPEDGAQILSLVGSDEAAMAFIDPPPRWMAEPNLDERLADVLGHAAAVSRPGALAYVCAGWREIGPVLRAGETVQATLRDIVAWTGARGPGGLYQTHHQLIAIFELGGQAMVMPGRAQDRSNVWTHAAPKDVDGERPCRKPLTLLTDAIEDATKPGDLVLDLFGAGILIAAEKCGRIACMMEADPSRVDRVIQKYERMARVRAVHTATGTSFAERSRCTGAKAEAL